MKKWLILFCLIVFPVFGQEISDDTFSENNPNIIMENEPRTFNGSSFVYIQGISDKPQPQNWMDSVKLRLFGSMEIPTQSGAPHLTDTTHANETGVQAKDFFGSQKELKYIDHTANWNFIIQPMDNKTMNIQENIQFLLTDDTPIIRSWPIDNNEFTLLKAQIDHHIIRIDRDQKNAQLDFGILPAGLHKISLNYVVSLPGTDNILLPLTSNTWPLITDTFSGIILNGKVVLTDPHFLLGQNLQEIPENFIFQPDEKENIFFQNSHILPAFTQIQLTSKISDKAPQYNKNAPFEISRFWIFITSLIVILSYLLFSACEIYFASLTYLLKRFKHLSNNSFKCWFYRMGEVTIGCFILLSSTFLVTICFSMPLGYIYWLLLILSTVTIMLCLDVFIFYPKQKMVHQIHHK